MNSGTLKSNTRICRLTRLQSRPVVHLAINKYSAPRCQAAASFAPHSGSMNNDTNDWPNDNNDTVSSMQSSSPSVPAQYRRKCGWKEELKAQFMGYDSVECEIEEIQLPEEVQKLALFTDQEIQARNEEEARQRQQDEDDAAAAAAAAAPSWWAKFWRYQGFNG